MEKRMIDLSSTDMVEILKSALLPEIRNEIKTQIQPPKKEQYLSRKEVCEIFSIDFSSLWRWTTKGTLTAYNIEGKVLYKQSEIDAAIEAGTTKKRAF